MTPAVRHQHLFKDLKVPRHPSYNQPDVSSQPGFYGYWPLMQESEILVRDEEYRNRIRTLQALEETIEAIVQQLETLGILDETYIFFTSDNGYKLGQHRIPYGKRTDYEEDITVPLFVRGPGITPGSVSKAVTSHVDLARTWAELGQVSSADWKTQVDGKSLLPFMHAPQTKSSPFALIEHWGAVELVEPTWPSNNTWQSLRIINETHNWLYSSTCFGGHRFIDLNRDFYQLVNQYDQLSQLTKNELDSWLRGLYWCKSETCQNPSQNGANLGLPLTGCFVNKDPAY